MNNTSVIMRSLLPVLSICAALLLIALVVWLLPGRSLIETHDAHYCEAAKGYHYDQIIDACVRPAVSGDAKLVQAARLAIGSLSAPTQGREYTIRAVHEMNCDGCFAVIAEFEDNFWTITISGHTVVGVRKGGSQIGRQPVTNFVECMRAGNDVSGDTPKQCRFGDSVYFETSTPTSTDEVLIDTPAPL